MTRDTQVSLPIGGSEDKAQDSEWLAPVVLLSDLFLLLQQQLQVQLEHVDLLQEPEVVLLGALVRNVHADDPQEGLPQELVLVVRLQIETRRFLRTWYIINY